MSREGPDEWEGNPGLQQVGQGRAAASTSVMQEEEEEEERKKDDGGDSTSPAPGPPPPDEDRGSSPSDQSNRTYTLDGSLSDTCNEDGAGGDEDSPREAQGNACSIGELGAGETIMSSGTGHHVHSSQAGDAPSPAVGDLNYSDGSLEALEREIAAECLDGKEEMPTSGSSDEEDLLGAQDSCTAVQSLAYDTTSSEEEGLALDIGWKLASEEVTKALSYDTTSSEEEGLALDIERKLASEEVTKALSYNTTSSEEEGLTLDVGRKLPSEEVTRSNSGGDVPLIEIVPGIIDQHDADTVHDVKDARNASVENSGTVQGQGCLRAWLSDLFLWLERLVQSFLAMFRCQQQAQVHPTVEDPEEVVVSKQDSPVPSAEVKRQATPSNNLQAAGESLANRQATPSNLQGAGESSAVVPMQARGRAAMRGCHNTRGEQVQEYMQRQGHLGRGDGRGRRGNWEGHLDQRSNWQARGRAPRGQQHHARGRDGPSHWYWEDRHPRGRDGPSHRYRDPQGPAGNWEDQHPRGPWVPRQDQYYSWQPRGRGGRQPSYQRSENMPRQNQRPFASQPEQHDNDGAAAARCAGHVPYRGRRGPARE